MIFPFAVIGSVMNGTEDLSQARQLLGQLLHTLQDFYSHSNWIELGKKTINERLGLQLDIGPVASPNQSTCRSQGCVTKKVKCVSSNDHPPTLTSFIPFAEHPAESHSEQMSVGILRMQEQHSSGDHQERSTHERLLGQPA